MALTANLDQAARHANPGFVMIMMFLNFGIRRWKETLAD
jgi:hypothetical protein